MTATQLRPRTAVVAVCGVFHFRNYIRDLDEAGGLDRFIFSHKFGANVGLPRSKSFNLPMKEYLVHGHHRLLGGYLSDFGQRLYGAIWAAQAQHLIVPSDILHVMLHGHERAVLRRAKSQGSKILGEVVNAHPDYQRAILADEASALGLSAPSRQTTSREKQLIAEAHDCDALLAPSDIVRQSYVKNGFADKIIYKIPYAANLDRFYAKSQIAAARPSGPLNVICVGLISLRKGQIRLLQAAKALGQNTINLTLVGHISPELSVEIKKYADYFHHIERIDNKALVDILHRNDVFVLPSLEEGLAVANCEAMASGLAVVTTAESGAGEIIEHGVDGLIVPAGSTEALARELLRLHHDRDLVASLGANAAAKMRDHQNWRNYVTELMSVYQGL